MIKGKMKAQVFYEAKQMKFEEIDIPEIKDNEVLVKVKACGICGSDIAYYFGKSPVETPTGKGPIVLGHEISGEVVAVGSIANELNLFKVGDRVLLNPAQQCNACPSCSQGYFNLCEHQRVAGVSYDGGFTEYVKVSYTHIYKIPEGMSYEQAAFVEPLACASYGVKNLDPQIGDFVVIFGPGPVGLLMLQLIKSRGAGRVAMVGIFDYPLEKAKELGADYIFNTLDKNSPHYVEDLKKKIIDLTDGRLAERVIVPTNASDAMQQALEVSGKRSTVVYFGLPGEKDYLKVPALETITSDKTLKFSWLAPMTWTPAIKAISTGKVNVDDMITHKFSLEDVEKGIQFMASNTPEKIKGMIIVDNEL